jgi:hypothetical protein
MDTTGQQTFTGEPTAGDILYTWPVHPQTGIVELLPMDREPIIPENARVGLRVTAGVGVNADAFIEIEE